MASDVLSACFVPSRYIRAGWFTVCIYLLFLTTIVVSRGEELEDLLYTRRVLQSKTIFCLLALQPMLPLMIPRPLATIHPLAQSVPTYTQPTLYSCPKPTLAITSHHTAPHHTSPSTLPSTPPQEHHVASSCPHLNQPPLRPPP